VCVCVCVCACVGRCSAHMDAIQCVGTQTDVIPTFLVDVGIHPWPRPLEILSWVWVDVGVCMCVCVCVCVCVLPSFKHMNHCPKPGSIYLYRLTSPSNLERDATNHIHNMYRLHVMLTPFAVDSMGGTYWKCVIMMKEC
jgi:hypothetical protein